MLSPKSCTAVRSRLDIYLKVREMPTQDISRVTLLLQMCNGLFYRLGSFGHMLSVSYAAAFLSIRGERGALTGIFSLKNCYGTWDIFFLHVFLPALPIKEKTEAC